MRTLVGHCITLFACIFIFGVRPGAPQAAAEPPVFVNTTPDFLIGTAESPAHDPPLFEVSGSILLPDGGIIVANGGVGQLHVYSQGGHLHRVLGKQGAGPGEFRTITVMSLRDDEIIVFDGLAGRITSLDFEGNVNWDGRIALDHYSPAQVLSLADGSLVATGYRHLTPSRAPGLRRGLSSLWFGSLRGGLRPVTSMPGLTMAAFSAGGEVGYREAPFGPRVELAVWGQCVNVFVTDEPVVRTFHSSGVIVDSILLPAIPSRSTNRDLDTWLADVLRPVPEQARPELKKVLGEIPIPEFVPAYSAVHVDELGLVWLQQIRRSAAQTGSRWTVRDQRGGWTTDLWLPFDLVHDIGTDRIAGLIIGPMDEEIVAVYGLRRSQYGSGPPKRSQCQGDG